MFIQNIQGQRHMYCVTKYTCNWHVFFLTSNARIHSYCAKRRNVYHLTKVEIKIIVCSVYENMIYDKQLQKNDQ